MIIIKTDCSFHSFFSLLLNSKHKKRRFIRQPWSSISLNLLMTSLKFKIAGTVKALPSGDATSLCDVAIKTPPTFLCLINDTQYHNVIKYPLGWFIHIVVVVDCIIEKKQKNSNISSIHHSSCHLSHSCRVRDCYPKGG